MNSSMISKVQKAKLYAEEKERLHFESFKVSIRGDNSTHTVEYNEGNWGCTCEFFALNNICSHTMAMEHILEDMLPEVEKQK